MTRAHVPPHRLVAFLTLSIGLALALAGCGSAAQQDPPQEENPPALQVQVSVDDMETPQAAAVLVAQQMGYFGEANIEAQAVEAADGADPLDELQGNNSAFAFASQDRLGSAFGCEEPYSVLAVAAMEPPEGEPASYGSLLVANDLFLVRRTDDAIAFVDAVGRACRYMAQRPSGAVRTLRECLPQADEKELEELVKQAAAAYEAADSWGKIDQGTWDGYFAWAYKNGKVENAIPAHHGYSTDYLDDAE